MTGSKRFFFLISALSMAGVPVGNAQQILLDSVRYESRTSGSKLIFDVSDSPEHRVYVTDNPSRLIIDVKNAKNRKFQQPSGSHPLFDRIRTAEKNATDLRIVVDLKEKVTAKTHKLATNNNDHRHLVVELKNKNPSAKRNAGENTTVAGNNATEAAEAKTANAVRNGKLNHKKHFIVAIDAGHGGDDPGARGPNGTHEKQVTLAIAKKLKGLVDAQSGFKGVLVRKSDYYVGLRDRMKIARKAQADLFISIHADAAENPSAHGASVYTLSRTGASNEAAHWLANHENAKEKIGGVNLDDKEEMVATVLLDLSQTATQQASVNLADKVLRNFRTIGGLHYDDVQKAGFVVLKSPDIPSILVETAYISNPSDELNLLSGRYQNKMANAIFKGILKYYEQMSPDEMNRMAQMDK
jgi:N-acetylmuramoyl-L-alanine amidase